MLRALRKPILGAAGLAVAAASLAFALPCNDALAAESVVKVSPAQTELIQSNLFMQNTQPAKAVIESFPSDWKMSTLSGGPAAVCRNGLCTSSTSTVKVRYDKIGQADGRWVSARLTFSDFKGIKGGLPNYPANTTGIEFSKKGYWDGFTYFNARSVDVKVAFFYTESGDAVDLTGSMMSFGSLNGVQGVGVEGVRYLTSKDYRSYVLSNNQLKHLSDGTWKGNSQEGWRDVVGDPTYNKLTVCFLLSDPSPKFRLTNEGSNGASWVSLSTSALTAIVPPSPTKSATIAN